MCVLCVNVSNRARNSRKPQSLYVVYIPFFFVRVDYVVETPNPSTFFAQPSPSLLFFFLFSLFSGGRSASTHTHTHTHFYGRISSSSSYSLPCPVFLLLKIYGFTILEKYLGPLVSGRLLKKKENCWVERTRAFDLSGHNVRPLRSRRDVFFYLQPLQGNNKNIGSQKKKMTTRHFLNESYTASNRRVDGSRVIAGRAESPRHIRRRLEYYNEWREEPLVQIAVV